MLGGAGSPIAATEPASALNTSGLAIARIWGMILYIYIHAIYIAQAETLFHTLFQSRRTASFSLTRKYGSLRLKALFLLEPQTLKYHI